jgi:uncharacterized membrane protein
MPTYFWRMSQAFLAPKPAPAARSILKPPSMGTVVGFIGGGGGCAKATWLIAKPENVSSRLKKIVFFITAVFFAATFYALLILHLLLSTNPDLRQWVPHSDWVAAVVGLAPLLLPK